MEFDRREPWRTFEELQREANRLFSEFFEELAQIEQAAEPIAFSPMIDLYKSPGGVVVRAALPGMIQEDIDIFVDEGVLTIRGERQPPEASPDDYLVQEWPYGRFERSVRLPFPVDADAIRASYSEGVLIIVLPKA